MVEHTDDDARYIVEESISGEPIKRALLEVRIDAKIVLALYDDGTSLVPENREEVCDRLLEALMLVIPKHVESLAFIIPTKSIKKEPAKSIKKKEAPTGGSGSDDNPSS